MFHSRPMSAVAFLVVSIVWTRELPAEPGPGDLYREYVHTNTYGDAGGAIRVGGKRGESYPDRGSDFDYVNAWVSFPHELELAGALRAELVVEKIQSHNGTHGFAIQWNDSPWIDLPPPESIPEPQSEYYHHCCITVPIPLPFLRPELGDNQFRMRVSPEHGWNWPQHLVYGVHLRVYYDPAEIPHVAATMAEPVSDSTIGESVPLAIHVSSSPRRINRVDYIGHYEDVNWKGDGEYRGWHYFYYHGQLQHHLDSSVTAPWRGEWNTEWIPDQSQPIQIAARIIDDTDLIYMTPAATELKLRRSSLSVELCKPRQVQPNWVTRRAEYEQEVSIDGDLQLATAARLVWSSWSPGYMNGVMVNGSKVLEQEGPRYRYFDHRVDLDNLTLLKPGTNVISTGKTPLYDDKMVHGMEVNWPGIQLLIQYRNRASE